ncbi:acyltransferase domain-containing protein [Candidatus Desantisbacteria bacterium]|nr:acyltransferase domain-containing protein [Candidatus Desantisbacteria bacterium]
MGKELFINNETFRKWMLLLDKQIEDIIDISIIEIMYSNVKKKSDKFSRLLYSHPAIFMIEYSLAQCLLDEGIIPDYVFGSSMGEFAACAIADALDLENIILAIIEQAFTLEQKCPEGSLITILGDQSMYENILMIKENSELAGINFKSHFVISTDLERKSIIEKFLKDNNIEYYISPVSRAFHSSLIEPAKDTYISFLKKQFYKSPKIPIISSTYADFIYNIHETYLWDIIRKPVLINETIKKIESVHECIYLDLGPTGTMANFIKYNLEAKSNSIFFPIITPFSNDLANFYKLKDWFVKNNKIKHLM